MVPKQAIVLQLCFSDDFMSFVEPPSDLTPGSFEVLRFQSVYCKIRLSGKEDF